MSSDLTGPQTAEWLLNDGDEDAHVGEATKSVDAATVADAVSQIYGFTVPVQRPGGQWLTAAQHRTAASRHNHAVSIVAAPRRVATTSRRRPQARGVARTTGSRGDPHQPSESDEPEPSPAGLWLGFLQANVRLKAHLDRRAARAAA